MSEMRPVLESWFGALTDAARWPASERDRIGASLERICLANYGRIHDDIELETAVRHWYWRRVVEEAIARPLKRYAESIPAADRQRWLRPVEFPAPLEILQSVSYERKVDINQADLSALETLPGIGRTLARRIVDYRRRWGPFPLPADLQRVPGIGAGTLTLIGEGIVARDPSRPPRFSAPVLDRFARRPSLACYISLIRHTGGRFTHSETLEADLPLDDHEVAARTAAELELIAESVEREPFSGFGASGLIAASRVQRLYQRCLFVRARPLETVGVSVISDARYRHFISDLISLARSKVRVAMFFMNLGSESAAARPLVDELTAASRRGVDVRVLVDGSGSEAGSDVINRAAVEYLESQDVPVGVLVGEDKLHSKVVVVDDEHVVIGSHNWTAGSLFRYEDKTIYVASTAMAASVLSRWDQLWAVAAREGIVS